MCSPPTEANGFANMQSVAQAEAVIAQAGAVAAAPSEAAPAAVAATLPTAAAAPSSTVEGFTAEQPPADVADVPMQEVSQPLVPQGMLLLVFCGLRLTQSCSIGRVCFPCRHVLLQRPYERRYFVLLASAIPDPCDWVCAL